MLWTLQFPITDLRAFVNAKTFRLTIPSWLTPVADRDFVRSFGIIRRRPRGGLTGWLGESMVCEANRAIRFKCLKSYWDLSGYLLRPKIVYRRFYFDGLAVGKFEIGLGIWGLKRYIFSINETKELCHHFLRLPIILPNPSGEKIECPLWRCGNQLAKLYLANSSQTRLKTNEHEMPEEWWVQACESVMLISLNRKQEPLPIPFWGKFIPLSGLEGTLSYYTVPYEGQNLHMWMIDEQYPSSEIRKLRIFLLRLHAERECLRRTLRSVASGQLVITPRSDQSDRLQEYLREATRRIERLNKHSNLRVEAEVGEMAREAEDYIHPGERDELLKALTSVDIRKNILRKVEDFVKQESNVEIIMGDKYTAQQAGIVGPHGQARDITFNQIWNQAHNDIDLPALASELSTLRAKLKDEATEAEHDAAIGEIASAEAAAKKGDGPTVMKHLAKAGKWAFEVATKIGVTIASAAIKLALGL